jgi:hypothetical protein
MESVRADHISVPGSFNIGFNEPTFVPAAELALGLGLLCFCFQLPNCRYVSLWAFNTGFYSDLTKNFYGKDYANGLDFWLAANPLGVAVQVSRRADHGLLAAERPVVAVLKTLNWQMISNGQPGADAAALLAWAHGLPAQAHQSAQSSCSRR